MADSQRADFPCSLSFDVPFPTPRLASTALQALQVDPELSPLVRRNLSLAAASETPASTQPPPPPSSSSPSSPPDTDALARSLRVEYRAATNRMLRVSVNSFMDSLKLVLEVMEQLDEDVLARDDGDSGGAAGGGTANADPARDPIPTPS